MQKSLHKFLSLFFLFLFLYPQVESGIHELNHFQNPHCTEKTTHFCKWEHNCKICDFKSSSSFTVLNSGKKISFTFPNKTSFIPQVAFVSCEAKYPRSLRAPPVA